jgi:carboxyl-terminal processing protease
MTNRTTSLLVLGILCVGLTVGFFIPPDDTLFTIKKNFEIFSRLYEEVATEYVDPVDPEQLMETGIQAMLRTLDPYTVFIDDSENDNIDIMTEGSYGGVGLSVGVKNDETTVITPIEGYSASKQGVRAGDVITQIDSTSTEDLSMNDVQNMLRGQAGTTVSLQVRRTGAPAPLTFTLTRAHIRLENVTYAGFIQDNSPPGIGYIRLERFARRAPEELRTAIDSLQTAGPVNGLILDLRDNPGGLLEAAVEISDFFLPRDKPVVSTRGRDGKNRRIYHSDHRALLEETPLIVMVNGSSASASEIVAGAIQDLDRGIILGERTFGKGLVQVIKSLPYNTSLKMTVSRYYTPSGRSIQAIDYRHDDENGGAEEIPDSLRKTFTTNNGRTVRGGGGIEPDMEISAAPQGELERALTRQSAFFMYANSYTADHDSIPTPFTVDDTLLHDFEQWLHGEQFTYRTSAEQTLQRLSIELDSVNYDETRNEVQALREAIAAEKREDFDRHRTQLKEHLRREIVSRYRGKTEQIRSSLPADRQVDAALEILDDRSTYHAVLTPASAEN